MASVHDLWEQCAASESSSLTNMFEVVVRAYAKKLGVGATTQPANTKITTKTS